MLSCLLSQKRQQIHGERKDYRGILLRGDFVERRQITRHQRALDRTDKRQ
jgi:hypothetical protein